MTALSEELEDEQEGDEHEEDEGHYRWGRAEASMRERTRRLSHRTI